MATKSKPVCKFGQKCYRKNPDHFDKFEHEETDETNEENQAPVVTETTRKRKQVDEPEAVKPVKEIKTCDKNDAQVDKQPVEKFDLNLVKDMSSFVQEHYRMSMPDDFYDFLEFCKSLDASNPKSALNLVNIELCGVYDLVLFGYKFDYRVHSRFFYDPPEFQTVLEVKNDPKQLHFGYFRDDPNELPSFVAMNEAKLDGQIFYKGDNLFAALNWYIDELISDKNYHSETASKKELQDLKSALIKWLNDNKKKSIHSLDLNKSPKYKAREKKINCKTFHKVGICVPIDANGNGYREVPESYESQRKMFTNFCLKDGDAKKAKAAEQIQEIITLIQFANDECDPGMGLEFGMNMFAHGGTELHKFIRSTLAVSYSLLERDLYAEIIKEHLKIRHEN